MSESNQFLNSLEKQKIKHQELVDKFGEDYDKPSSLLFSINVAEQAVIADWIDQIKIEVLQKQGLEKMTELFGDEPYYGAIGGGLTYSFLPTSLGTILTVKEVVTGKELNVTEALGWFFYG